MTTLITSTELNYLVFRYLAESGFKCSASTFKFETGMNKGTINENLVPPASLVTVVQKGIWYRELEAGLSNDMLITDEDFQFIHPFELLSIDNNELQNIIKERRESSQKAKSEGGDESNEKVEEIANEKVEEIANEKVEEIANDGGPEPMDANMSLPTQPSEIPNSDVTVLKGHTSETMIHLRE